MFIAFATANTGHGGGAAPGVESARFIPEENINDISEAVGQTVGKAILSSMITHEAMTRAMAISCPPCWMRF